MQLTLIKQQPIYDDVATFFWRAPDTINWRAGQYGVFYLPHDNFDISGPERFFTISSAPYEKHIAFTTRLTSSSYKRTLKRLKPGDTIRLQSIGGEFVIQDPSTPLVFIAGGIGITPFRSMLLDLNYRCQPINITLIYQNKSSHILFKDELETLKAKHPQFHISYLTGPNRLTTQYIQKTLPNLTDSSIYIAGPTPMIDQTETLLLQFGLNPDQLYYDYFEYDWN